jgi:hypothetical protein
MGPSSPVSTVLGGAAGKIAGDFVQWMLEDQHKVVRNTVSALAEAGATLAVGGAVNAATLDVISATTTTPLQALVQGVWRAVTGESAATAALQVFTAAPTPALGLLDHHPKLFLENFEALRLK